MIFMATHNSIRLEGYLLENPSIAHEGEEGAEKVFIKLRTARRDAEDVDPTIFEDVYVFYDGTELMQKMKELKKFDVIDLKGVFNIVSGNKASRCPYCGAINYKQNGTFAFVYPQWFRKIDNIMNSYNTNSDLPDSLLLKHFKEVSNYMTIIGTVVSKPEMINKEGQLACCRYRIGVDRKYFVKTQPDIKADYPWVYSYGQQAEDDFKHLQLDSVVLVDGYIHTRIAKVPITCTACNNEYKYPDVVTDFIPYAIEYLSGYKTDEDIERENEMKRRMAENEIFNA